MVRDWLSTLFTIPPTPDFSPGLHTYHVRPEGGQIRIHLRVERDGSGVLFRDVTDVVHLNPSAAEIVKMCLDGLTVPQARQVMKQRYNGTAGHDLNGEIAKFYDLVGTMQDPVGCPTCAFSELERSALFSTPVNAPYKVDLALTYGCNNECPHCYNEPDRYPLASLPKEEWFRVIDLLHEAGVPHLILTGGEATLHPELPEIIRYADGLGQIVGLNTNGRRIANKAYMQTLAEVGLNHVQVTLGSNQPGIHDAMMGAHSFQQTVQGIQNALDSRVHVITNTTLMRANMGHAEEIIDFLDELGIQKFAMNGMIYSGGGFANDMAISESEMPPLLMRVRDRAEELGMHFLWYTPTEYCRMSPVELEIGAKRCNAGEYSMCIEPNGDVLPCQSYYVSAGNILRDSWEDIWGGHLFRSFRDREEDPQAHGLPEKCWECPDLPLCGGGCRIEREARGGSRVAEYGSGGGGSGCSGSCGTRSHVSEPTFASDGFVPVAGLTSQKIRGAGQMPAFVPIKPIQGEDHGQ